MTLKSCFILCITCTLSYSSVAQVVINEYSASNLNSFEDSFSKTEDWIELYNNTNNAVDIGGWHLSDKASKEKKWEIPIGTVIQPNQHMVFYCSGRDGIYSNEYHTNFKLSQTKNNEVVQLADKEGQILESYPLGMTLVEHSFAREIDGGNEWRICAEPSFSRSNNSSETFARYTEEPDMDLLAGFYQDSQIVTLINNEKNSVLRYTTDGTNPTANSREYSGPLQIDKTTVVKALAFSNDPDVRPGKMAFNTYFINEDYTLAVFSVAADDVIGLANGRGELIPIGSLEYFNLDGEREATSFGSLNRHGQDSWVLDHRSIDWVSRDEMGYSKAVEAPLFSYSERDSYQKFMFRNSGDDNYPALIEGELDEDHTGSTHIRDEFVQTLAQEGGMALDLRAVERVILFLNGEYWGVYGMRERPVDHDYTDEYYDQGKYEIQYLTTWDNTEIQYGGINALTDWMNLRDFIIDNDMSIESNYKLVEDSIKLTSLIDYMLVNLNTVASDWLNYNTGWWRGLNPDGDHKKWGYILWDLDAVFDYYINYTGVPNISPNAEPCDLDIISDEMDFFFNQGGGGGFGINPIAEPDSCQSILNGSSPYPVTDPIFIETINLENACCEDWGGFCQEIYEFISEFVVGGGGNIADPENCQSILDGSSPYPVTDSIFLQTIASDEFCCESWDDVCQEIYDNLAAGNGGGGGLGPQDCQSYIDLSDSSEYVDSLILQTISGNFNCCDEWDTSCEALYDFLASGGEYDRNVGQHEKIFLKLLDESATFQQLYYSRYADVMNTVFNCENMITTLDRMVAVIEPEMPAQIARWGGSMNEWLRNVDQLRDFISERCTLLDDGAIDCYADLSGPYKVTLMTEPAVGEIDFNTLDIEAFPWEGNYFGGMDNLIKAKVFNDFESDYEFSHWKSSSSSLISPDSKARKASIRLTESDTLTAVFRKKGEVSVSDYQSDFFLKAFPNPASDILYVRYELEGVSEAKIELHSTLGQKFYSKPISVASADAQTTVISLEEIPAGLYDLVIYTNKGRRAVKVDIVK